jgi:hypothetical protein
LIDHPDHNSLLHDVSTCPQCVTRMDAYVRDLTLDPGEPVPDAPGWTEARPCPCRTCQPNHPRDLHGRAADRLVIDDLLIFDRYGVEVTGRIAPGELARVFGVPASLLGRVMSTTAEEVGRLTGGYAEPDWSDPDAGTCQSWHDQIPADSHCAVCLWAPRDNGAFAQEGDSCVCQRGRRHSCGRSVGVVPNPAEPAPVPPAPGRWTRLVDRYGWPLVWTLTTVCLYAVGTVAIPGLWWLATVLVVSLVLRDVGRWVATQPNPTGMPGWEIRRGRTLRVGWRRHPIEVGVWRWRHSLDGGPWSPWWWAVSYPRAVRAVGRWLSFPVAPAGGAPLASDAAHYRPATGPTEGQLQAADIITQSQAEQAAAGFLRACGIPCVDPDCPAEAAFEGITIHGPGDDPNTWAGVNTSVAAAATGLQAPGPEPTDVASLLDPSHYTDLPDPDQPCWRCGVGRVRLSDVTGLCATCKKEPTA